MDGDFFSFVCRRASPFPSIGHATSATFQSSKSTQVCLCILYSIPLVSVDHPMALTQCLHYSSRDWPFLTLHSPTLAKTSSLSRTIQSRWLSFSPEPAQSQSETCFIQRVSIHRRSRQVKNLISVGTTPGYSSLAHPTVPSDQGCTLACLQPQAPLTG